METINLCKLFYPGGVFSVKKWWNIKNRARSYIKREFLIFLFLPFILLAAVFKWQDITIESLFHSLLQNTLI
jgi:glucose-6-phosphate-specific signal transduction histidine kinase